MSEETGRLVSIILIVIVVVAVVIAIYPKIAQVIKPVLGWNVSLSNDEVNKNSLDEAYLFYSRCRDVGKTNCACKDAKSMKGFEGEIMIQANSDGSGIKLSVKNDDGSTNLDIKMISGIKYCYLNGEVDEDKEIGYSPVSLYLDNGKLFDRGREDLGEMANPLVLYKWSRKEGNFLCITSSEFIARQINAASCFS